MNEALRLLVRRYHMMQLGQRMDKVGEAGKGKASVTESLFAAREDDD
ncbi:MAG: hypothetical protein GF416_07655 [Candidatus Altiarchaeales archaeon]|nr:hypothetical protein [Candidatus Altiarchaeales archaeon]